jgi:putative exosortase-associated protein (TIGR04073 family)
MGLMGMVSPALAYDDSEMPPGIDKFSRGLVNATVGAPEEVITHMSGAYQDYGTDTLGGAIASIAGGAFIGLFWGVARMGSGIVDMVTFPFPFNDNEPLVEPDHHI